MLDSTLSLDAVMPVAGKLSLDDWIERHQKMVFRTAWRMLGSAADAEDVTQDVFLKAHARMGDLSGQENPAAWLYRVTVNQCLDLIRRRRPVEEWVEVPATEASPEKRAERQEALDRLARLLLRLPPQERAALILRDLEGLTSREAGQILGVSEETVRTAIFRAKEKLRQWMT
jgi:RNA polymerase sigma-70 factor (ECF subfamily)